MNEDDKKRSDVEEYESQDHSLIIVRNATTNVHAVSAAKVPHIVVTAKGVEAGEGVAVEVTLIVIDV